MTADGQISILIEGQDKLTATLTSIEKKITKFGEENARQSQKMANSWEKSTNQLIALGNVASTVDNIFSSLTNLEIRLENATERLANAQDRLADSQKNVQRAQRKVNELQSEYIRVTKNGGAATQYGKEIIEKYNSALETLQDSQTDQQRATRALTIAENNLARAQNQVLGTYINIGIQSASLAKSLPALAASMTPLGLGITATAAAFGGLLYIQKDNVEVQQAMSDVTVQLQASWDRLGPSIQSLTEALVPLIPPMAKIAELAILGAEAIATGLGGAIDLVSTSFQGWKLLIEDVISAVEALIGFVERLIETISRVSFNGINRVSGFVSGGFNSNVTRVGDAVIRPDGSVIQTDPRDTLVAMKDIDTSVAGFNRGGLTVNVYGNNMYGVNAQEISRALARELSRKINI